MAVLLVSDNSRSRNPAKPKRSAGTESARKPRKKPTPEQPEKRKTKPKRQKATDASGTRKLLRYAVGLVILAAAVIAFELLTLPNPSILQTTNPTRTAFMKRSDSQRSREGLPPSRMGEWRRLSSISSYLKESVLVSEDDAFYSHNGFDYNQVKVVLKESWDEKKPVRGASTISQQLAKNLYLSASKNPLRKIKEIIITKRLEKHLSKDRILEIYLNVIEWGDGVFGCDLATHTYFGTSPNKLRPEQAALLAAMLPNPKYLDPRIRPEKLAWKRKWILQRLRNKGILSQSEYARASQTAISAKK